MTTWTSSDYHVGHVKVVEYCKRPFFDVEDMTERLVAAHNARVKPDDLFYFLGDFAMGQRILTLPIGKRLNGYKILIGGNHDSAAEVMVRDAGFNEVHLLTMQERNFYLGTSQCRTLKTFGLK